MKLVRPSCLRPLDVRGGAPWISPTALEARRVVIVPWVKFHQLGPTCELNISNMCVAATLRADELDSLFQKLYSTTNTVKQDAIFLSYMEVKKVERRRQRVEGT